MPDDTRLRLASFANENNVLTGQYCILKLRDDCVIKADDSWKYLLARFYLRDHIVERLTSRHHLLATVFEFSDRGGLV